MGTGRGRRRSVLVVAFRLRDPAPSRSRPTERIEVLHVERAERGFDRRAEAGYAIRHAPAKERDPDA